MTPFLWGFIGAGLGGFFGLEALTYEAWPFMAFPGAILIFLFIRSHRVGARRYWLDLAGYNIGAGLLGAMFLLPQRFSTEVCSGFSSSGGCDFSNHCWSSGPSYNGCTTNYTLAAATTAYLLLLATGCAILAWPATRALIRRA